MPTELIDKLEGQLTAVHARQETALGKAEADGASEEDRAAALAEFDAAEGEKTKITASLTRARKLHAEQAEAARQPATAPIVMGPARVHRPQARQVVLPDNQAHGVLRAFKGERAAERAYEAGLFAAATLWGHKPSMDALADLGLEPQAVMSTVNNGSAAYFVPTVISRAVIELTEKYGVFRRFADVQTMTSDTLQTPRWNQGMTAYWVAEGSAPAESSPGWDMVELVAKNLAAKAKMTRQLDEDAIIDLGDKVTMAARLAFSEAEDRAGFFGDGSNAYGGIVGLFTKLAQAANAASLYTATGHATLAALDLADYEAVAGMLPNYDGIDPRWYVHKTVYYQSMLKLALAAGGTTSDAIAEGGKPRFLGYPVEFVNVGRTASAATTGTIPVLFGDLSMSSKLGDRRKYTFERGMENDDFSRQLFTMLATERVDIVNHTVTDPRDGSKPGPVVGLKIA